MYQLHELTWLWRTAELPPDAVFLREDGHWRPVGELVEPILEAQSPREKAPRPPARPHLSSKWWWGMALCGLLLLAGMAAPDLHRRYASWKMAQEEERSAWEHEQSTRKHDFISTNLVIPGMTHEEVRRIVGPPRSIKATGDGNLERWVYRTQIIVFESGKVVGVEAAK